MNSYIFITQEGSTYQPDSDVSELEIENCQVVGFAKGNNANEAMKNLVKSNEHLLNSNFKELICIEMKNPDYYSGARYFDLEEYK